MKLFTIHTLKYGIDPEPDVRAVKEGFNWWAFAFSVLWAVMKGYWWVAFGVLAVSFAISVVLGLIGLDLFGQAVVNIAFNLLFGFYANDLARWSLSRRGYIEEDVVSGVSQNHAVESYVRNLQTI